MRICGAHELASVKFWNERLNIKFSHSAVVAGTPLNWAEGIWSSQKADSVKGHLQFRATSNHQSGMWFVDVMEYHRQLHQPHRTLQQKRINKKWYFREEKKKIIGN